MKPRQAETSGLPFYAYSPFNRVGGRAHPRIVRLKNRVLDLWAGMADYGTISERLDISISTVVEYIKQAKDLRDPRAIRPYKHKLILQAEKRRLEIREMSEMGLKPSAIAKRLKCSTRLVEIRIREMGDV